MITTAMKTFGLAALRLGPRRGRTRNEFRPSLAVMEDRLLLTGFPNGSVNVAVIGGSNSINGGFLPESGTDLTGIGFTNLAPSSVNAGALASFDTVVLHVSGSQGMNGNINNLTVQAKQDIVSFIGSGHKLVIYNSETSLQDYSWLPYAFKTSNPGQLGASGTVTVVENNTLSSNTTSGPYGAYFIDAAALGSGTDAIGDGNVMTTFDPNWNLDMTARNALGVTGPIHTYAEYSSGGSDVGLIIYNGMDVDTMASSPNTGGSGQLRKVYVQELRQPFDPSGLPHSLSVVGINLSPASSTDTVGGTHTVTATITDQLANPLANVHVTFTVTAGPNAGVVGTTTPLNGNTNASGQVSFAYTSNGVVGTDKIIAQFTNAANQVITSQQVTQAWTKPATVATTTHLTSDVNPSSFGQPVTFSATVTPNSGGGTPTGTVSFYDGATFFGSASYAGGTVSVTTSNLTVGSHSISAAFGGGPGFDPSQASLAQVVNQAATTTALASSLNPSTYGGSATFTASVSSAGGSLTGSVEFFDGAVSLGVVPLAGGTAALATSALTTGSHGMTAVYSGDPNFLASSNSLTQVVNRASTTTALASNVNPSTVGQSVTFTASVSSGGGSPTGSVEFFDGATSLGVVPLTGGSASVSTSALAAGSHAIAAVYSGDTNFLASQGTLAQTVRYGTTVLGNNSKAKESGSTLPVKLEVTDYSGVNLSSPGLAVKAVGIAPAGSSAPTMPAQDAGRANPDGLFRYDSGRYIFNLKLVDALGNGLAAGDYTLFFTIGDGPTLHTFSFSVKAK